MLVINTIKELKERIKYEKKSNKTIGFVPTMGYLHEGHLSLVKASTCNNDITVMSIYVNPTQFGINEDFSKYPRDIDRDIKLAGDSGVDILFVPTDKEMYPEGYKTSVHVKDITDNLCGRSRPGHFEGVATIVTKLFNIVEPDRAYFGQKDAQQVLVIKKMVDDLNMNTEVINCPIIREDDGLAMSSRNVYLHPEQRIEARVLSQSLFEAAALITAGERSADIVRNKIISRVNSVQNAVIDYVEIVNTKTLQNVKELSGGILIALAVRFGNTRLIDNVMLEV